MSRLRLTKIAQPNNPPTNTQELYYDTTLSKLAAVDQSGNQAVIAGFAVKDYRLVREVSFTANQSPYTPSAGVKAILVECVGGGGGGGGIPSTSSQASAAGGGGGGSLAYAFITSPAASYTVTIGAAANGGAAGANPGTAGNDTSFGAACIGKGGSAGAAGTAAGTVLAKSAGGAGGVAGTGDVTFVGDDGEDGLVQSATVAWSGGSGGGPWGGKKRNNTLGAAGVTAGVNGGNYGAGGSGAVANGTQSATAGGNGAQGICRVWEFA